MVLKHSCHGSVFVVSGCAYFWSPALNAFFYLSKHVVFVSEILFLKCCAVKNVLE
jgi:hypothetical protein